MFFGYFSQESIDNLQIKSHNLFSFGKNFVGFLNSPLSVPHTLRFNIIHTNGKVDSHTIDDNSVCHFPNHEAFETELGTKHQNNTFFKDTTIIYCIASKEIQITRDIFGITPIYYIHIPNKFFAFSSSLSSLVATDRFKDFLELDSTKMTQYLTFGADSAPYDDSTFYKYFKTVLPGYTIHLNSQHCKTTVKNQFELNDSIQKSSLTEIADLFKNAIKQSTSYGMKGISKVCSQLSGGLDSSSISSMIHECDSKIPIYTIYAKTNTQLTDESYYALEVSKKINSKHFEVLPTSNFHESASLHIGLYGHPEFMQNGSSFNQSMLLKAKELGCSNLFSGHPGDGIVGYGGDYLIRLFDNRQWTKLKALLNDSNLILQNIGDKDHIEAVYKTINSLLSRQKAKLNYFELFKLVKDAKFFFNIPNTFFIYSLFRKIKDKFLLPKNILQPNLKKQKLLNSNSVNAIHSIKNPEYITDPEQYNDVFQEQAVLFQEEIYILEYYYGVKCIFPFYDKTLFEICLSTPSELKFGNGIRRAHFREAMKGILPESVRLRRSKGNFGMYGRTAAIGLYEQSKPLLSTSSKVWNYVNRNTFFRALKLLKDDQQQLYVYNRMLFYVSRTVYLAIWLDKIDNHEFVNHFTEK
ncbi:asparagine synthase [Dyadobacter jejuensis]|uniref:asparagine synthase (glutamine-hydrolyzing) n=1 Tax=Dyadobacter jejuensis TaxID=1082580 RepID=A0A316ARG3_9BACT|nr:asparagine synthase C-terminal domain-containing protein [Dyadobacter jejuensis]PWJ60323.1 asparagine synthase [Dyadobacter jejuensis]